MQGLLGLSALGLLLAYFALITLAALVLPPCTGRWRRTDVGAREVLTLSQLGPFVRGIVESPKLTRWGGRQTYAGLVHFGRIRLKRRDFGLRFLEAEGFPAEVARSIAGSVVAKLNLRLEDDGAALRGAFVPQKIEFRGTPPEVTRRHYLEPQAREWVPLADEQPWAAEPEQPELELEPAPEAAPRRVRRTV